MHRVLDKVLPVACLLAGTMAASTAHAICIPECDLVPTYADCSTPSPTDCQECGGELYPWTQPELSFLAECRDVCETGAIDPPQMEVLDISLTPERAVEILSLRDETTGSDVETEFLVESACDGTLVTLTAMPEAGHRYSLRDKRPIPFHVEIGGEDDGGCRLGGAGAPPMLLGVMLLLGIAGRRRRLSAR